jgi:parallel beta-helix repeat protein
MIMKLEKVVVILLVALTGTLSVLSVLSCEVRADPDLPVHNIDTGIDYATIQEAINANVTSDGHRIQVDAGVYPEHLVINKSISLVGQDKLDTIIDGNGNLTVIQVTVNNVSITGFTLQNTATGYSAIRIEVSANNNITDNIIKNTYYGIRLQNSHNNTIVRNQALNNSYTAIYLFLSTGNTISNCSFANNVHAGVFLFNSNNNHVHNNTFLNSRFGISLTDSDSNVMYDNKVSGSESGIRVTGSSKNLIYDNKVSGSEAGILLSDSDKNTVTNNTLSSNIDNGILLESANSNFLLNNTAQDNENVGVNLSSSSNNTLLFNHVSHNQYGIQLLNSDNCTINENKVFNNSWGILLSTSGGNSLWHNNVRGSQQGIHIDHSSNNTIINNNFINNTQPLDSINSTSLLDNGLEGNYWSNYNGTDANHDAIGDTPYTLAENNTDNQPLMGEFFHFIILIEEQGYPLSIISNSTISDLQFDETAHIATFNVTGSGTEGFCRIQIPKILVSASHVIVVDDRKVETTLLPISNTTHQIVYFTYALPAHQVMIVSEPYYDLLEKYDTLLAEYHDLNSTYNELSEAYNTLLTNFTQLQGDYDVLRANFTQLQDDHSQLVSNFTQLQSNYQNLNMTHHQLISNYDSLQNNYNILLAQNESLTSIYNNLVASHNDLQSKYNTAIDTRNLVYALTATVIGVAAILFSMNMRFRRKISEQDRIIQAYNPLEIARILFMDDVEKRGVKIGEFEEKHGIKIQPRNTLEDVLKDLEKKEKKGKKTG